MRISDWSSDVCSSDLGDLIHVAPNALQRLTAIQQLFAQFAIDRRGNADVSPHKSHGPGRRGHAALFCAMADHGQFGFGRPKIKAMRSEEHTSELQSLMRISYAVFCLKKKNNYN